MSREAPARFCERRRVRLPPPTHLVLRHENQVLRRQLSGRLRWDQADWVWLAALSRLVSRRQWAEVFPVAPATILRWHRNLAARKRD